MCAAKINQRGLLCLSLGAVGFSNIVAYSNVIVRLGLGLGLASGQVRYKVTNLSKRTRAC